MALPSIYAESRLQECQGCRRRQVLSLGCQQAWHWASAVSIYGPFSVGLDVKTLEQFWQEYNSSLFKACPYMDHTHTPLSHITSPLRHFSVSSSRMHCALGCFLPFSYPLLPYSPHFFPHTRLCHTLRINNLPAPILLNYGLVSLKVWSVNNMHQNHVGLVWKKKKTDSWVPPRNNWIITLGLETHKNPPLKSPPMVLFYTLNCVKHYCTQNLTDIVYQTWLSYVIK